MTATFATDNRWSPRRLLARHGSTRASNLTLPTRSALILLAYLAAIAAAEVIVVWRPLYGIIAHAAVLALLLIHASFTGDESMAYATLALTIGPLVRIMSVAMPVSQLPPPAWYAIISVPLFIATFVIARLLGLGRRDLGLRLDFAPWQWVIASAGIPLGLVEYVILRPRPLAASFDPARIWLPALILVVCTGFLEEVIFRGLLQRVASDLAGGWGIAFVSALFAVLHIGYRSVLDVVFVFLVAQLFAACARSTRSIIGVTIAHGLTNVTLFLVFPFLLGGVRF